MIVSKRELEPQNAYNHYNLALLNLYELEENPADDEYLRNAIGAFRNAIAIKASLTEKAMDKLVDFIESFEQLGDAIPDKPEARFEFAKYLDGKGEKERADQEFQKAIEGWQSQLKTASRLRALEIHKKLADVYMNLEQYETALNQYQEALRIAPCDAWTFYRLGNLYEEMGNEDKAIESYEKAVYFDGDHSWAYYNLAKIYESRGVQRQSLAIWKAILRQKKADPEAKAIAQREVARYYEKSSDE